MILNWRKASYTFNPKPFFSKHDSEKTADVDSLFFSIDTETVTNAAQRCEPICYQVSGPDGEWMEYMQPGATALHVFLSSFLTRYQKILLTQKTVFMWCHNLLFDWGQLCKERADLLVILRTGMGINEPLLLLKLADVEIYLRKGGLYEGTSPFFEMEIKYSHKKKTIIKWRDTYSYFPASLDSLGKTLNLAAIKLERPDEIGTLDYRLLHPSDPRRIAFEAYSLRDPLTTKLVAEQIRTLHRQVGIQKIRVSAPSYAMAYLMHTAPWDTKFVPGPDDATIMQLVVDAYNGGRTGGVVHGAVSNIGVYDLHSSYPASMLTLPSFSDSTEYARINPAEYSDTDLIELMDNHHTFIRVSGTETDSKYPALIQNIKGALTPVYGEFRNIPTTGVEFLVGVKSGSILNWTISEMVVLIEMNADAYLPFREFILSAYTRKQNAEKGSPDYNSAKLALVSCYGKLIESRTAGHIAADDEGVMVPCDKTDLIKWAEIYYADYVRVQSEHPGADYYDAIQADLETVAEGIPAENLEWLCMGELNLQKLEYGRFAIPAAAALITATSRARLCVGMRATTARYWDTDSLFITDIDLIDINKRLVAASECLPSFIQPVKIGDELGDLGSEIQNASGYLAGTKRYWLWDGSYNDKGEKDNVKSAIHGMAGLKWEDRESALCLLATGKGLEYKSKPRPVTPKQAKTPGDLGRFDSRTYHPNFHLDSRLSWVWRDGAYHGDVCEWSFMAGQCEELEELAE